MIIHPVNMENNPNAGRVILSGASGMIGSALRDRFALRQTPTLQLVRRTPAGRDQLLWDPAKSSAVSASERLEGCVAAIHLAGANLSDRRWTARYRQEIWASRVDSTRALAATLAELRQPPASLLLASAIGFYGSRGDEELTENSAAGSGFLADLCREWENAAEPAIKAGIRVVHLRTGVVLGRGHGALERMLPVFRMGLGGRLGNGRQWMSWISLTDAVNAILLAMENPSISGPLNLTAPNPVTNAEFTRALGRELHRPSFFSVPAFALRLALGQIANEALLASARVYPAKLQAARFPFAHPTIEEALSAASS